MTNTSRRRSALLVFSSLLVAAACTETVQWQGTIHDRDGVTHVENPSEGLWREVERAPFRLELEQTFGVEEEPEEKILGFITGVAVDDRANVYVLDRRFNQIVAFDREGSVIWKAGRAGQGPGEMQSANGMSWDGQQSLFVSNQNGARVDVWDLDGNYVYSRNLADLGISTAYVVGFLDPATLVVWTWGRDRDGVTVGVLEIGEPWRVKAEFFVNGGFEDDLGRMDGTNIEVSTGGGRIRTGHRIEYLLREFDGEGRLTRTITRDVPNLVPALSYRGTGWNFGEFLAPMLLPSGHSLAPRFWAKDIESPEHFVAELDRRRAEGIRGDYPEFEAAFDLLDPQGRYLGSIEAPANFEDTGVPALVGPDGRLYTRVFEPFPQVRRYRVEIAQ